VSMICPKCGSGQIFTVDSRPMPRINRTRRRKQCVDCCYRFTTYELTAVDLAKMKR
jgi:transcriptional repressor NrdR